MSETPAQRFQRVLNENNLSARLEQPQVRFVQDGAVLIEQPTLTVTFTDPTKEVPEAPATTETASEAASEPTEKEVN